MDSRTFSRRSAAWISAALLAGSLSLAQSRPANPAPAHQPAAPAPQHAQEPDGAPVPNDRETASTQDELIRLLKMSPTLTTVVSRDPSLLANQDYVARNNPQLARFLLAHPEVVRNPDFYLFTHLKRDGDEPDEALERAVWPEVYRGDTRTAFDRFWDGFIPLLAFACGLTALLWLTRMLVENRRWSRVFKIQSEVHGKLIEKFTSNQELATYMESESGRKFLEAAPIAVNLESSQRVPNAVARVLTPLQIGIVLVLLGTGLMMLRHAGPDLEIPMLVTGTIVLMPGIGFIISAGVTWLLAARLGLMPERPTGHDAYGATPVVKDRF